jgi:hypothetical protein
MIGSLLYLTATRPDIQFSVCLCARFQASPRTSHRQAVKCIFRYMHHTLEFDLWYSASSSLSLHGFSDADFARCRLDRKSTSGTCQFLGSSLVSWSSRKQSSVAEGPKRLTRQGESEWELIKILLERDEDSNKTNTASNTRLRLTT